MHCVAAIRFLHPELALRALLQLLLLGESREGVVRRLHVAMLSLVLFAAHPRVPGRHLAEQAVGQLTEWTVQFTIRFVPTEFESAAGCGAAPKIVVTLNASLQCQPLISLNRFRVRKARAHLGRMERLLAPLGRDARTYELLGKNFTLCHF